MDEDIELLRREQQEAIRRLDDAIQECSEWQHRYEELADYANNLNQQLLSEREAIDGLRSMLTKAIAEQSVPKQYELTVKPQA